MSKRSSREAGYEVTDASARGILIVGLVALFVGFLISLWMWWLFLSFKRQANQDQPRRSALARKEALPPEPRLELNPRDDYLRLRSENLKVLTSAAWIDKNAGIARIPIEDAMKLFLEEQQRRTGP